MNFLLDEISSGQLCRKRCLVLFLGAAELVAFLIALFVPLVAAAGTDTGSVRITVVDAQTKRSIALARVYLNGAVSVQGYSDGSGRVEFSDVPAGEYRILVYAPDYVQASDQFNLEANSETKITATLSRQSGLSTIATVTVRARPATDSNTARANGTNTLVSGGLSAALSELPSVSRSARGVEVDGLGIGGTAVNVDGAPVAGNGGSAVLSPIGMDLFHSVTAEPLGGLRSPGIDLSTDDPTIAFASSAVLKSDSLGGEGIIGGATGTIGSTGFVVKGVDETAVGPLQGSAYADESGFLYSHSDEASGGGLLAKVRAPISQEQSMMVEGGGVSMQDSAACAIASGGTPCGFGVDGQVHNQRTSNSALHYIFAFPNANLAVTASTSWQDDSEDDANRFIARVLSPQSSSLVSGVTALGLHFDEAFGQSNTLTLDGLTQRQSERSTVPGLQLPAAVQDYQQLVISDAYSASASRLLTSNFYVPLGGSSPGVSADIDIVGKNGNDFAALLRVDQPRQPMLPQFPLAGTLDDPGSDEYDCLHQRVFVNGVGPISNVPADTGSAIGYKYERPNLALNAQVSYDTVTGGLVNLLLPGTASGPNAVTPALLAGVEQLYESPYFCGSRAALTPQSIAVFAPIQANLHYGNAILSAARRIGPIAVAPFIQYTQARYRSASGLEPVPFVPDYRAGVIIDGPLPRARADVLAYLGYTGNNNAQGLPPHLEVNLGSSAALMHGVIAFGLDNVLNSWSARFSSSAFAAPLPNGIVPIAQPLEPRTWHAVYTISVGAVAPPRGIDSLAALAAAAQPATDVFTLKLHPLDQSPEAFSFKPDTMSDTCTPEAAAVAREVFDAMKTEMQRESGLSGNARATVNVDPALKFTIIAVRTNGHLAFEITSPLGRSETRFVDCVTVHYATVEQLRSRGAFVPTDAESNEGYLFVDGEVGVYRVIGAIPTPPPTSNTNGSDIILDPPPATPPDDPFKLRASCPPRLRPFAAEILAELAQDVTPALSGRTYAQSRYFKLTLLGEQSQHWLSIQFLDALSTDTIERCAHVAGISRQDLRRQGIEDRGDDIAFTRSLGLFISL